MAETEDPSRLDDPTVEITEGFSDAAGALFSAGSVTDTLQRVVDLSVEIIEGCDYAGIFLLKGDAVTTPVHTHPVVIEVDALQHRTGEGPCLDAITNGGVLYADDLAGDARWPRFGPQATAAGVRTALALTLPGNSIHGALNLYARYPQAFGVIDRAKGLLLGALAGQALSSAAAHDDGQRRVDNLQGALASREVIGQAQGILIERERITPAQAFDVLRRASQHLNIKLRDVAQALVDTGEQPLTGLAAIDADNDHLDLPGLLAEVEAAPPVDAVDVLATELARLLHATEVSLLIANLSGTAAVRMSHATASRDRLTDGANERVESLSLDDSVHHRVLKTQEQHVERRGRGWQVLVPITERGDAMGILEVTVPQSPSTDTLEYLRSAAHALAYTLIASRRHTDLFEWAQRDVPFSLAAEIQRRLLPASYTVEGGPFTLAGWLEPAASVGGDTFDYSVDREYLYASVTDAMGHSTEAALLATLAVGSLRNTRRTGASPAEQADAANAALMAHVPPGQFVTGQILRIRLADGVVDIVNAGHPAPYLLRAGAAAVLEVNPDLPLGLEHDHYRAQRLELEAGDRLLILTDGFLERNGDLAIGDILVRSAERHPREVVRELAWNLLATTGGNLRDDATVLCIDWFGRRGVRNAIGGASVDRATSN